MPDDRLLEAVYGHLKAIAARQLGGERAGHTLQATALVHEAYLRLAEHEAGWDDPGRFYAAAAEAMRRVLIDHARGRGRVKRGGDRVRLPMSVVDLAAAPDEGTITAIDEAIEQLAARDERAARIVELRFWAGLTVEQTAEALGLSPRTVMREWSVARAWLYNRIRDDEPEAESEKKPGIPGTAAGDSSPEGSEQPS